MKIVETRNLSKIYGKEPTLVRALTDVNIAINEGEFVAVVGASGSGKTTLLNMLGGLDTPSSGEILYSGRDISKLKPDELTVFRREQIGFVFQHFNLLSMLTIKENICWPVEIGKRKVDNEFYLEIINMLGLVNKVNSFPKQLSGGQQQRVAIARALLSKPQILLADEPTGNLDSKTSHEVMNLFKQSSERYHQTMVMITHNEEIAKKADRIIRIEDGRIV